MFDPDTQRRLAGAVLEACRARRWRVASAESRTGGFVSAALTAVRQAALTEALRMLQAEAQKG